MSRMFTVVFPAASVNGTRDLFDLAPIANKPIRLHKMFLGTRGALPEQGIDLQIIRGLATVGTGGSAQTPEIVDEVGVAAGFTALINNTTLAVVGGGTTEIMHVDAFNVKSGYPLVWTPETRIRCSAAKTRLVVRLNSIPSGAMTVSATVYVSEE